MFINGKRGGETPFRVALPPGRYKVEVRKRNFLPVGRSSWTLELKAGQEAAFSARLMENAGRVEITSNIDAEILVNGELRGKAPLELKLSPGDYTIRLQKEDYVAIERAEWQITAKPGNVTTLRTTFRERRYKTIKDRFYIGVGVSGITGGGVEGEFLSMSMPGSFLGAGADVEFNQIYAGIHWVPNTMVPIYEGSVFTTHAGWRFRLGGGFAISAHYTHKFVNLDKMARDDYQSDY